MLCLTQTYRLLSALIKASFSPRTSHRDRIATPETPKTYPRDVWEIVDHVHLMFLTYQTPLCGRSSSRTHHLALTPMSHTAAKDFEIVIVGGGVCGLACAIALAQEGIPTEVYEAAVRHHTNSEILT